MSTNAELAMRDAGWNPRILNRRLKLFDLHAARGVPMEDARKLCKCSRRTAFYDWAEIRAVLGAAAGPELEEVRARGEARLERVYTLLMAEVGRHAGAGGIAFVRALREARKTVVDSMELRGAIDRRAMAVVQTPAHESRELMQRGDEELRAIAEREGDLLSALLAETNGHG